MPEGIFAISSCVSTNFEIDYVKRENNSEAAKTTDYYYIVGFVIGALGIMPEIAIMLFAGFAALVSPEFAAGTLGVSGESVPGLRPIV